MIGAGGSDRRVTSRPEGRCWWSALLLSLLLCLSAVGQEQAAQPAAETPAAEPAPAPEVPAEPPAAEPAPAEPAAEAAPEAEAPAAEEAVETPAEEEKPPAPVDWISGSFRAGVDAAFSDEDSDIDLDQTLRLRLLDPNHPNWSMTGSLWVSEDLDSDEARPSALRDLDDAYGSSVRARLMDLYFQYQQPHGKTTIRFGRQRISEGPWYNRIDGLYVKQRYARWDWYAFGGMRASLYEDAHDDVLFGGGASYRVTDKTRVGIDFLRADDHRHLSRYQKYYNPVAALLRPGYPRRVQEEVSDTEVALNLWHDFTPNVRLFSRFTINDSDADEFLLDLTGYCEAWDLTCEIAYRHQLQRIGDRVSDLTAFYRVLGPENEYGNLLISLHKPLTQKLTLSLEGELHDAKNDDWRTGNRDYWKGAAILSVDELATGLDASLALERWDVEDGEGVWAVTGEIRKTCNQWEFFAGADYERYRDELVEYNPAPSVLDRLGLWATPPVLPRFTPLVWFVDTVEVDSRENIYSLYTGFDWSLHENQRLRSKISFEDDESDDSPYWRIQASYEIKF
ncbi:MAG: hypothetical protein HYV26_05930 [Candidatus Hydrogenedentes bacterium]|nr:hypothetical protein [Candidatus Hydrogenedentota bacterium]